MPDNEPHVVSVIINWNNYDDTHRCLKHLLELDYPNGEILLIDNGSSDGSSDRLESAFQSVEVERLDSNRGFGRGVNVGFRNALRRDADYIWLINNDIIIEDRNLLSKLVKRMEQNRELAFLSPKVLEYPNTDETWFERGYMNWDTAASGHTEGDSSEGELVYNDYIPFCSGLVRAEVIEDIGFYPEDYFLYWGDVEYCDRALESDYKIGTDLGVTVKHEVASSSEGPNSPTYIYYELRNRLLLARKFSDRVSSAFFASYLIHILEWLKRSAEMGSRRRIVALSRGVFDGMRGKTGRGPYP